jgi:hypothetical protein
MNQERNTRKLVLGLSKAASTGIRRHHGRNAKSAARRNEYRFDIETNQAGKYVVRIRARFGRHGWKLSAYFLASSLARAMKKLEQMLQQLQRHEDRLWFWGVDRSDDPNLAGELLKELGLQLDRRAGFPRKAVTLSLRAERPVPAFAFASIRRLLAESVSAGRTVAAND